MVSSSLLGCYEIEFLIVDADPVRLRDRKCQSVFGNLFRINREASVPTVSSFKRVRINQFVGHLWHIASCGQVRLLIETDRMNLGVRRLISSGGFERVC